MRTINFILLIGIMLLLLPGISFSAPASGCVEVSSSLLLYNNIEGAPIDAAPLTGTACVKIIASNVVFNCNGYNITNNGTGGTTYGILLNGSLTNVTVKNCPGVSGYTHGIYLHQSEGNTISNNTAYSNSQKGFYLWGSDNNTLNSNNASYNSQDGFFFVNSDGNNLTDNIASYNRYYGIRFTGSYNNSVTGNNATYNNNCPPPSTYYISQQGSYGEWEYASSEHFPVIYATKEFQFSKVGDGISLRIVQNGSIPFGDVDAIKLSACGQDIAPDYARYVDSGESILEDIIAIDHNVIIAHEKDIEVSWTIPDTCNEPATLSLTANEYSAGQPLLFPYAGYASMSQDAQVPTIDGKLDETDGVMSPTYSVFWRPDSGHPAGYTYIYTSQDENNVYISLDITPDNTNEFGEDWIEAVFTTSGSDKAFRVDDYNSKYGKCGFGLTSKVPYKHQTCELSIPKSEIEDSNLDFMIRYYGTGASDPSAIILELGGSNVLARNDMSHTQCGGHGGYLYQSSYNTLTDNTAGSNSGYGLAIYDSNHTTITGDHYFNNSLDFVVQSHPTRPFILTISNAIFDNPLGNLVNYTRLSLSDSADATGSYSISWAQTPSSPPNQSFQYKTLDISLISGTVSIDSLSMNWLDSELTGYNENGFQLWKYDEVWTNMDAALNAAANTLTLTNFVPASSYSILQGEAPAQVTPSSSSGSDSKKPLTAVYGQVCPGDLIQVNVTSSGSALENAEARLIYIPTYTVLDKLTNSTGSAVFSASGAGGYKLIVSKSKYFSYEETFTYSTCPGQDTTAPKNVTPPVQPPVTPSTVTPECVDDSGCASEKYCSNGSCTDVTGTCGYAANHVWTNYECCTDGDCQSTSSCKNHECTLKSFDITGSNGSVGSNSTVTLFSDGAPLANTELKITKPDGSYEILKTGSDGKITFPLSQAGVYKIEFISSGTILDSLTVTASEKEPEPEAPMPILGVIAQVGVVFLLLILLLVGAFLIYRFFISKGKGGKR